MVMSLVNRLRLWSLAWLVVVCARHGARATAVAEDDTLHAVKLATSVGRADARPPLNARGFAWLKLPLDLDDAFRIDCLADYP